MRHHWLGWLLIVGFFSGGYVARAVGEEAAAPPSPLPPAASEAQRQREREEYELFKTLVDVMDQVEENYVEDVDRRELLKAAIRGVLSKLDPYSNYIEPTHVDRFRSSIESEFGGIGIQVGMRDGHLTVLSPIVGTPAYKAGVLAGDRIIAIEGEPTKGLSLDECINKLKGKAGTAVTFTIQHVDGTEETVTVRREVIRVETVLGDRRNEHDAWNFIYSNRNDIAYIRMTSFSRDTASELRQAIEQAKQQGMKGLVLDLRFNPGGLLESAIEVCDMFIKEGRIVSTKDRGGRSRTWDAKAEGTLDDFPMAILVNRFSASASEIVSACLQDHKRAVIVGERTWGKGSVQNVINLEGGGALKLTTAAYFRPSGRNIHRTEGARQTDEWGVSPDEGFKVQLTDAETADLIEWRRQRDVVQPHLPPELDQAPVDAPDPAADDKPVFVDRQLQKAIQYVAEQIKARQAKMATASAKGQQGKSEK